MHKSVEAFSIKTLNVSGFEAATEALRLPFGNKNKPTMETDRFFISPIDDKRTVQLYERDITLLSTLVRRGDEHAKVLRGVMAWCEINAPRYFWQEMDRYRIGCECLSSESTMHIQGKGMKEDELVEMKEHLEEGTMQKRVWMFSYQTLRRIYFQRRNHRLPQWRKFCEWISSLPFAKELIIYEDKD